MRIDWTNPSERQLEALLYLIIFKNSLGPHGSDEVTYGTLSDNQEDNLILKVATAFDVSTIGAFNSLLKDLQPIIKNPHSVLMIDPDGAQEALMSVQPKAVKKRHPLPEQEEDSDENY